MAAEATGSDPAPDGEAVVVPDVIGRTAEEAGAALDQAGISHVYAEEVSADTAPGTVLRTDPPAGQTFECCELQVFVAIPIPGPDDVPDLRGLTYEEAVRRLHHLGIAAVTRVDGHNGPENGAPLGTVWQSIPGAGTPLAEVGDTITVYVTNPEFGPDEQGPPPTLAPTVGSTDEPPAETVP